MEPTRRSPSTPARDAKGPQFIWHAYPLGVLGADQTGGDRTCRNTLRELIEWLPHLSMLGTDTLLLGPIFSSLSHGYDTVDHRRVDDRIGTAIDLRALIEAASRWDIRVMLDGAFAYASRDFAGVEAGGISSSWFSRDAHGALVPWHGIDSLITPDFRAPGYREYVVEVMTGWMDQGIAGWRLDSAWSVPPQFWRAVLTRVRAVHPGGWFLGQVFDDELPEVITESSYSSVTEYALMHGIREWLCGGRVDRMLTALDLHRRNSTGHPVHTFLGNHDVARLADVIDHDESLAAAFAVLLTLPGVPGVYYGDEYALRSDFSQSRSDSSLRPRISPEDAAATATDAAIGLTRDIRELARFRRSHPWLMRAAVSGVRAQGDALSYTCRAPDGESISVFVNPSGSEVRFVGATGRPVLGLCHRLDATTIAVTAAGWCILRDVTP